MARFGVWFLGALLVFGGTLSAEPYPLRWFWLTTNFSQQERADRAVSTVEQAARAGLNGVVVSDVNFGWVGKYGLDKPEHRYLQNLHHFLSVCRSHGIAVIPAIYSVSDASGILAYDPNLAAGFEVRDAEFEVEGGVARLIADPRTAVVNGGFEAVAGDRFGGWDVQDRPGKAILPDSTLRHSGLISARLESAEKGGPGRCQLRQSIAVTPHRHYRVTAWVKTAGLTPARSFMFWVFGESQEKGRFLTFTKFDTKSTEPWRQVEVTFNSLDYEKVALAIGLAGAQQGQAWIDDVELTEVGLVNVLRRPGCPLTVRDASGSTTYVEGDDFFPVFDPKLGRAEVDGTYDRYHEPPVIRMRRKLPDGTRLRVSFYHPLIALRAQVDCCLTEPKVQQLFKEQVNRLDRIMGPVAGYLLYVSEFRTAGGCASCKTTGQSPGQLLASHVEQCFDVIRKVRPKASLALMHDMFAPTANARDDYYLVLGSLAGSWDKLGKDVLIYNWGYEDQREKTLANMRFFSDRGHWQITSVPAEAGSAEVLEKWCRRWLELMDSTPQVRGMCYYTHTEDYTKLALFGRLLSAHEYSGGQQSKPGD